MSQVKHVRLITNHLVNLTNPDKFVQQLRPLMEQIVLPGQGIRPGVLFVCVNGAHRAPTGACVALVCAGTPVQSAMRHLYKIRRVVDFSTKHSGITLESSLPPYEAALVQLGRQLHIRASLPPVVQESDFEEVRWRRFLSLAVTDV